MKTDENKSGSQKKNMSAKEKEKMWEHMMDCCCSEMSEEEKKNWKRDMHKMKHHMKAHGGGLGMGMMMGHRHGMMGNFMPMDLCRDMMSSLHRSHRVAALATPEVQGLFEDWVEQIGKEILAYLKDKEAIEVEDVASHFKISKESAYYFLTRLAQKEKIDLKINKEKS